MKSLTRFPSELTFGSLLVYAPQGTSELSALSQRVAREIKNCREGYIERVGQRFQELFAQGRFGNLLGPTTVLVPAPRSNPTVEHMHWPALRICQELASRGLCQSVERLLERRTAIRKSATSQPGQRPSPEEHATSMGIIDMDLEPERITIVDDVVTRGSTLLGCAWTIAEKFPAVPLRALAVVRTLSKQDVLDLAAPIDDGRISLKGDAARREP